MGKKTDWNPKIRLPNRKNKNKHGILLPSSIRCGIIGPSGCGKTSLLIDNYIMSPGWLNWEKINHVYIYSKSFEQDKYKNFMNKCDKTKNNIVTFIHCEDDIIPLNECEDHALVLFDDYILENQNIVREYFTRGRHKNIDLWYLAQTYSKIPKQLIRDNLNFLNIFRQDDINLKHIYQEFVCGDMNFEKFKNLCYLCWQDDFGFITIDITRHAHNGKYRRKIKDFLIPYSNDEHLFSYDCLNKSL